MKYKEAVKKSMEILALDERVRFIGYNVIHGSRAYGTLRDIPEAKCIETPVAENLMAGLAIGMSLEGFRPVLFFERHDFLLNALDSIVNHMDKIERISSGQYKTPIIMRAVVGSKKPLYPGLQHTQDYTEAIKKMVSFPVIELNKSEEVILAYRGALSIDQPIMLVEKKELYGNE